MAPQTGTHGADAPPNYGRWRAATLLLVHLLVAAHIVHWKLRGETLAPLELNEVIYTLEVGIITAGFLFMCATAVSTVLFGRFFCSWGCHMLALQDLSAWLLRKLRIRRPRPVRSRVLLLVPPLTVVYMLFWPQLQRIAQGRPPPVLHLRTDAEGWASFITQDFWRNLPGPWIAGLTFALCGFAIVYVLGSRGFCTYACPYGAIFAACDRLAPGRIRVTEDCVQCATCTGVCSSGVRVHEEVERHGMVVNSACLKDLDCVAACPQDALYYGWGRPSFGRSAESGGRFGSRYDFSPTEDLAMGTIFLLTLFTFRGLYGAVPFLMTLALGAMLAFLAVHAIRLTTNANVRLRSRFLRRHGRFTRAGWVYAVSCGTLFAFVGHSAYIRYHEVRGLAWHPPTEGVSVRAADETAQTSYAHLLAADRHGLFRNERLERALLAVSTHIGRSADRQRWALRVLDRHPGEARTRLQLAEALVDQRRFGEARVHFAKVAEQPDAHPTQRAAGHLAIARMLVDRRDWSAARAHLEAAIDLSPQPAEIHAELGGVLAELGLSAAARAALEEAVRLDPEMVEAYYNLGTLHLRAGLFTEAAASFERALARQPDDGMTLNNLALALEQIGRTERAVDLLERALVVDPGNADAHFNLARLRFAVGDVAQAEQLLITAAELDDRYRQWLFPR